MSERKPLVLKVHSGHEVGAFGRTSSHRAACPWFREDPHTVALGTANTPRKTFFRPTLQQSLEIERAPNFAVVLGFCFRVNWITTSEREAKYAFDHLMKSKSRFDTALTSDRERPQHGSRPSGSRFSSCVSAFHQSWLLLPLLSRSLSNPSTATTG